MIFGIHEVFVDRGYRGRGSLLAACKPTAFLKINLR